MAIEEKISETLALAARNNWDRSCSSWRWDPEDKRDIQLEVTDLLSSCRNSDEMMEVLERARVTEGFVRRLDSEDEAGYSCSGMDIDPDLFRRGVCDMAREYRELLDGDPGDFASDGEIMEMDLEGDSVAFPFGQEYVVATSDAWTFLGKIGIDPDEVIDRALEARAEAEREREMRARDNAGDRELFGKAASPEAEGTFARFIDAVGKRAEGCGGAEISRERIRTISGPGGKSSVRVPMSGIDVDFLLDGTEKSFADVGRVFGKNAAIAAERFWHNSGSDCVRFGVTCAYGIVAGAHQKGRPVIGLAVFGNEISNLDRGPDIRVSPYRLEFARNESEYMFAVSRSDDFTGKPEAVAEKMVDIVSRQLGVLAEGNAQRQKGPKA